MNYYTLLLIHIIISNIQEAKGSPTVTCSKFFFAKTSPKNFCVAKIMIQYS